MMVSDKVNARTKSFHRVDDRSIRNNVLCGFWAKHRQPNSIELRVWAILFRAPVHSIWQATKSFQVLFFLNENETILITLITFKNNEQFKPRNHRSKKEPEKRFASEIHVYKYLDSLWLRKGIIASSTCWCVYQHKINSYTLTHTHTRTYKFTAWERKNQTKTDQFKQITFIKCCVILLLLGFLFRVFHSLNFSIFIDCCDFAVFACLYVCVRFIVWISQKQNFEQSFSSNIKQSTQRKKQHTNKNLFKHFFLLQG